MVIQRIAKSFIQLRFCFSNYLIFQHNLALTPNISMAKNFKLIDEKKRGIGAIIWLSDKFIPLNKDTYIIPISYI